MATKKDLKKLRIKKKKWFEIALPEILKGTVFTEGYAESPEALIGRGITASLGEVLKSVSKRHINIKLVVDSAKTSIAQTKVKSLEVGLPYLQRKARKNSKVSGKFVGVSSDGSKIDLRLCVIIEGHCLATAKREMRRILTKYLEDVIKKTKKDDIIIDVISAKIQNNIRKEVNKIHPIRSVELEKLVIK